LSLFPFLIYFLLKIGFSREEAAATGKEDGFLSCGAPATVKEMEGKGDTDQMDSAQRIGPHISYLMRDNIYAPSSHKFFPSFKTLLSAIKVSLLFGSPNLFPDSSSAPSCTQENPLINLGLQIDLIFFLQFILIDPFIQKS
jgi:hypothetical protein